MSVGQREINTKNKHKNQDELSTEKKYQIVDAVWGEVVDKERWATANKILDANKTKLKVELWKAHSYILTGLVQCPHGCKLTGSSSHGRAGKKYAVYQHKKRDSKCACGIRSVSAPKIEKAVLKELRGIVARPAVFDRLVLLHNKELGRWRPDNQNARLEINSKLKAIDEKIDQATEYLLCGEQANIKSVWESKIGSLATERKSIESELSAIETLGFSIEQRSIDAKSITEALAKFIRNFENTPVGPRKRFLYSIFSKIKVIEDGIELEIRNPAVNLGGRKPMGQNSVNYEGWLLRTDLNRRPSD